MTASSMLLKDLLVATKDGDWGQETLAPNHTPRYVIRGADFPDVPHRKVDRIPLRYLPDRTVDRRTLEAGDILLETAGGTQGRPTGRTVLITQELLDAIPGKVIGASFTRFLRVNEALVDSRYLYWYLTAIYRRGEMAEYHVQHTGVGRFQYTTFAANKQIPLLPLEQQRSIAEVLGALDDKIAANDRLIVSADRLGSALLRQALVDRSVPLVEVAVVTMGSSPPGTSYNEDGIGMPFYQGVRDFGVRFPTRRVWTTAPVRTATEGDVLLSVRAPVGRTNVANEQLCLGRGVAGLRPRDGRSATLLHQVRAAHEAWAPYEAEGTVFGSINKGQLESIDLPAVDPVVGEVLDDQLGALETRIATALEESRRLAATRDELLPLLMSGKLRVKDIGTAIPA
ncbi:hypothetical protein ACFWQC_15710 [Nocardioides sp. NPDC058538]|uniref:restriction endonuclease subunit S n=1 Tax=Nocardioides sp. NPDC058538 TaxID=3346542 RepID=UPI00365EF268